ncbi:acyl-CoA dehydrogenase [Paraherbaspirillum soli]|uniref:Acyl-CoA dehydrogenase n=1 Tax=Paraherbaspirillum soli TaxID=631222 RepID=A0ABW0MDB6_9BURK
MMEQGLELEQISEPVREHDAVAALERAFGDPWDSANPLGFTAILAADERAEMLAAGERMLDELGVNAEFVPREYGGRLHRLDRMMEIWRAVFRHDPCLGLGYGASSLIAAVNVWTAGSTAQRRRVAELLLRKGKLACAYHELEHGNDLARADFEAMPHDDQLLLNGGKQVIANIERADAFVLYARTDRSSGSRSHSQLLVEKSALAPDSVSYAPRFASVGMRGVPLGGIALRDCPVAANSVLGTAGRGLETALKCFQVTRVALPGMFIGILDTGLRLTLRYARQRTLYGKPILDLPQTRAVLSDAFADLLLCDCFTTVVARSLHVVPGAASVYGAAVKYLVPQLLIDAMSSLSAVLGAQFYLRDGEHALFQKLLRDLKPAGFGHAARVTCQMTILPQLPQLARRSWLNADPAPAAIFQLGQDLPPFSFQRLALSAGGQDPLSGSLTAAVAQLRREHQQPDIVALGQVFVDRLRTLKDVCAELPPSELSVMASPRSYRLSAHYATVLAASACLNLWLHNRHHPDPFLRDPAWLQVVLHRLRARLGQAQPPAPAQFGARLLAELLERQQDSLGFDLAKRRLPGWGRSHLNSPQSKESHDANC